VSTIPTAAAVISAIEDALQPFGVRIAQCPVTPHRLVELIANSVRPAMDDASDNRHGRACPGHPRL
jgi:hypothetical protein